MQCGRMSMSTKRKPKLTKTVVSVFFKIYIYNFFCFGKPKTETAVSGVRKPKTEPTFKFPNYCILKIYSFIKGNGLEQKQAI